ncbi:DgyrCDS7856 [Dimorphilus gyrociliatus]|uniref:Pyridoxal kinase n=1 Tax=Dimorphilus gyrociliatus TaxID=2664684 RepID=A0A7I8VX94_9ANNE|nr:DgyrCDS7856 [Dimorphilus gyrociliatus]
MDFHRVLSIQSHVVSGYVGNKSACFPLQVLGFEVDTINSVQFSNHTGYKNIKGQVLNSDELNDLYLGLASNNINNYSHLLTGYVGSVSFLKKISELIKDLKKTNPGLIYVCDPVLGDQGKLYVPKELVPIYREEIIPEADVLTPNDFEVELLTGIKVRNDADAIKALDEILGLGVKIAIISSAVPENSDVMYSYVSRVIDGKKERYKVKIPILDEHFIGTGDLFAALMLAWLVKDPLKLALEKAISTMQAVLKRTLKHARDLSGPGNKPIPAQIELQLIQSKRDIENPEICVTAVPLVV